MPTLHDGLPTVSRAHRDILDALDIGVVVGDNDARASYANAGWVDVTGQTEVRSFGAGWLDIFRAHGGREREDIESAIRDQRFFEVRVPMTHPATGRRWLHVRTQPCRRDDTVDGFVATVTDITEERAIVAELSHAASYDALTGVLNRNQFVEFLRHALAQRERHPERVCAVLFVDVDLLKRVNDRDGHAAGDRALITAARAIEHVIRPTDIVARFGGDEFIVLCDDLNASDEAVAIGERIVAAGQSPGVGCAPISLSVGLAWAEHADDRPEDLIHRADQAMYRSKRRRRRSVV